MHYKQKVGFLATFSIAIIAILLGGCQPKKSTAAASAAGNEPFPGKIAIITNTVSQNEEEFRSAEQLIAKYGADKIVHVTWPDNFMAEQEQMITTIARIAGDRNIHAYIINQAVPGTNAAVDRLRDLRGDEVFVVYANPQENPPDVSRRANLTLNTDDIARGPEIAKQAQAQGAKTFVHYSFPRHMSNVLLSGRRDGIRETAEALGITFIDASAPDPTSDVGITGAQQFIFEDVPRKIAQYGEDTAFFATNCAMMVPLIRQVFNGGAIFPEPCDPSPVHGFPSALGIQSRPGQGMDIPFMIDAITKLVAEKGVQGRLSTWPAPAAMTFTSAGAEYAIKWINGEVDKEGIDTAVVTQLVRDYISSTTGFDVQTSLSSYTDMNTGETLDNYKLLLMGHLVF